MQRPNLRARRFAVVSAAAAAGMFLVANAGAADISWIGAPGVPLDFGTGANWAGGAVPDAPDDAIISNGGVATVAPAFTRTVTDLRLGIDPASSGALTQTGGTINATGNVAFGENMTGTGTLNMSGGVMNVGSGFTGDFSIGDDGGGTATISGGAINTRFAFLGRSTNGHGHVTQTGGTLTVERNLVMAELKPANLSAPQTPSDYTMSGGGISVGNEMYIGAHGPVTFNLSGTGSISVVGALHIAASGALQDPPAGVGTLNMSGGTFNVTGGNAFFVIGDGGAGTMNFSAGHITTGFYNTGQNFGAVGIVNHTGGAATANFAWVVGEESRGANVYDLSGGTVTVVGAGGLMPGDTNLGSGAGGKGTLKVRGTGVANIANNVTLGGANFAGGTLDVSGGTVAIGTNGAGTGKLLMGDLGTGTLIISGGHVSTDLVTFGQNAGAVGTGTQTGGTFISRSNFTVGESSTGDNVFDISGGTLAVGGGSLGGSIFVGSSGNGTFRVGGTANVTAAGAITNALAGTGTVAVTGGNLTAASMNNRGLYTQSGGTASVGVVTDTGSISVTGGSLTASSIAQGALQVSGGQVTISPDGTSAATSVVNNLDVSGTGKLNLTNNALVVPYSGASPLPAIRADIVSGYNGGAWNGNGIISSQANSTQFGLGYGEASSLTTIPPIFGTVTGDAVLVRFTRYGDADLNGQVNLADFNRLASNFGVASGAVWTQGDFDYNGNVNLSDFNRLAANFGLSATGPEVTPQDWANLAAAIPEPAGGFTAASFVAAAALTRRSRRSLPLA